MRNFSPRGLILFAYGLADYQIAGDPAWLASDDYDVEARAGSKVTVQQMEGPMLQSLLEDRLRLTFHRETKQLPVFELSLANGAGRLQPSKNDCVVYDVDAPPTSAPAAGTVFCGRPKLSSDGLNRILNGAGVDVAGLAGYLERWQLRRPVIDRTGLTGTFDIHLEWTADAPDGAGNSDLTGGPSIFTALRQQLGLKLESTKGPVEVLVIDHVEKPSGN